MDQDVFTCIASVSITLITLAVVTKNGHGQDSRQSKPQVSYHCHVKAGRARPEYRHSNAALPCQCVSAHYRVSSVSDTFAVGC